MKTTGILKSPIFWTIIGVIVALGIFIFGEGIILRPRISISSGAIDYKIPMQYQMEIMQWKMLMSAEEIQKQLTNEITTSLRKHGFAEDRITLLLTALGKKPVPKVDWKPNEQYIIRVVIAEVTARFLPAWMQKAFDIPSGALFFEIENRGWASAKDPHIVIRLGGSSAYGKPHIESDNKILNLVVEGAGLSFDCDRIAPGSKTKGIIWYSHAPSDEALSNETLSNENEISMSYDQGTVHKKFPENEFFISGH